MTRTQSALVEEPSTPLQYASRIARYISDPSTIRVRTLDHFGKAPSVEKCRDLRAVHEAERAKFKSLADRRSKFVKAGTPPNFRCGHPRSEDNTIYTSTTTRCQTCFHEAERMRKRRYAQEREARLVEVAEAVKVRSSISELFRPSDRAIYRACEVFAMLPGKLLSRDRHQQFVRARHAVMLVMYELPDWSTPRIAKLFGMKCHSSVLHGLKAGEELMTRDAAFCEAVAEIFAAAFSSPKFG